MTRPANSKLNKHSQTCALVLEGNQVKVRLIAERLETKVPVHVDWLRFTCQVRNAPMPSADVLFPPPAQSTLERPISPHEEDYGTYEAQRFARFMRKLQEVPDADFALSTQAVELAMRVLDASAKASQSPLKSAKATTSTKAAGASSATAKRSAGSALVPAVRASASGRSEGIC